MKYHEWILCPICGSKTRNRIREDTELKHFPLSALGIMMIIFGMLIVAASLYMYMSLNADKALLFVGSLSGVIADFIGAVFIKMYTKNIEAAVKFHAKFAESNNLLLANSIANKIEDDKLRETTLSEISKNIILSKGSTVE